MCVLWANVGCVLIKLCAKTIKLFWMSLIVPTRHECSIAQTSRVFVFTSRSVLGGKTTCKTVRFNLFDWFFSFFLRGCYSTCVCMYSVCRADKQPQWAFFFFLSPHHFSPLSRCPRLSPQWLLCVSNSVITWRIPLVSILSSVFLVVVWRRTEILKTFKKNKRLHWAIQFWMYNTFKLRLHQVWQEKKQEKYRFEMKNIVSERKILFNVGLNRSIGVCVI